jgi:hypothetical protein
MFQNCFYRMPPKMIQEMNEPTGPFRLDPELLEHLDNLRSSPQLRKVQEFDLEFLKSDVNIPSLSAADIRAKIMPLSPPKPLDPNLSITRRSLGDQRQNSPKKDDPILVSSINHISSPDTNTALLGLQQIIEFLQSSRSTLMLDHENDFMRAIIQQLKHLRNQDPVSDHQVAKTYRNILTAIDAVRLTGPNR